MKSMKSLIATICILGIMGMAIGTITRAGDTVTATVTIGTVEVTVDPTDFDYGTIPFSTSEESFDVIDNAGVFNIKATVGTLETDLDIKGANSTGGTGWTLAAAAGAGEYAHKFGIAANGTTKPASYAALTTNYEDNVLAANVVASDSVWFGLEIWTPISGETTQQSAAVTIRATWSQQ